jgi:outer membrane protein assembly factor BamE
MQSINKRNTVILFIFSTILLSGCGCQKYIPSVYKMDIRQGNDLTRENVSQLKPGLTKEQVIDIMGSPMLDNLFHKNRWDYFCRSSTCNGCKVETQHVMLHFKNDKLVGIKQCK